MYRTYNARPIPQPYKPPARRTGLAIFGLIILLAALYIAYALFRPLPHPKTTIIAPVVPGQVSVNIPWPQNGQAAFGADEYGYLTSHNEQKPSPTASVTKVITAMAVLEKKPLKPNEPGPAIPITAKDVQLYNEYVAKDGAAVPVLEGETITQYQALQAMMLPSANNIADTTAFWAFGSMENYITYANQMVKKFGMVDTTVADASGFSPQTVSTARDLVRLGDAALDHPVLAEIVSQKQATFPNYGTITNVNSQLGIAGIRGIKTGNTEEAGGCYLAAADIMVAGQKITVITAIIGSTNRPQAMKDSIPIIQSAVSQFQTVPVVRAGQPVGKVTSEWGHSTEVTAEKAVSVLAWNGTALAPKVTKQDIHVPAASGTSAGTFTLSYLGETYTSDLHIKDAVTPPSSWWRLTHPF